MKLRAPLLAAVAALAFTTTISLALSAVEGQELGAIDFPTSGSAAAQPHFIKGVLLMHSFEYDDAKEAFVEAQKADPGFAMAYWGEAMTYNHPVWQQTAPDLAKAALAKLAATPEARQAKASTPKEKEWLAAVELLYGAGDASTSLSAGKLARDTAYAEALRRMHDKYPADDEVTSFYALAILGTSHNGRDYATYMRAAALVEQVYAKNPKHPGAAHYLIHSYDDPIHAPLGLRFADAYSKIAPAASHALHMPSHIYFALGMWDEAAAINERSVKAADDRRAAKSLDVDARGFHALHWLEFAYLQQGRYDEAKAVLAQIEADAAKSGTVRTRSHLAVARAAWLIETRRWADVKPAVTAKGLADETAAADLFAIGFASLRMGNRIGANKAMQDLATMMAATEQANTVNGAAVHDTHGTQPQTGLPAAGGSGNAKVPQVMAQELEAVLLFIEGRREEALVLARQAAVVEDGLSFEFGPPNPVKPAHELAAELLMDLRRPKEAMEEYEASLRKNPRRAVSLLGLARAATAARDQAVARKAYAELKDVWKKADKSLPELREINAVPLPSSR